MPNPTYTRRDMVVRILSEPSEDQTLISYARLIWVCTPSVKTGRLSIRQNTHENCRFGEIFKQPIMPTTDCDPPSFARVIVQSCAWVLTPGYDAGCIGDFNYRAGALKQFVTLFVAQRFCDVSSFCLQLRSPLRPYGALL
ncbi:Outer membrane receptor protein [Pseudomonas syringae pv. actinidiae]|nr:Outer membrane receptor protein [Pseudomonas syringae pv. actinidiae]